MQLNFWLLTFWKSRRILSTCTILFIPLRIKCKYVYEKVMGVKSEWNMTFVRREMEQVYYQGSKYVNNIQQMGKQKKCWCVKNKSSLLASMLM